MQNLAKEGKFFMTSRVVARLRFPFGKPSTSWHVLRNLSGTLFWMIICLGFGIGIIHYPMVAFAAARRGLLTWWEIVLPSLLPFFIVSELLMGLGFVTLLGAFMEPAMRPLFNLPGTSAFIIAVSYISGFPLCAILTSRIRHDLLCTRDEGERLIAFTSNASPLFMLGAVSIGMYKNPALGPLIAGIHYSSNLLCGIMLKFMSRQQTIDPKPVHHARQGSKADLLQQVSRLREQSFGSLLGETVQKTTITLLTIGGFITLFSVVIGILEAAGWFNALIGILTPVVQMFQVDPAMLRALLHGLFEITIGINEASKSAGGLVQQLLVIEALLAWNGLAIQAQVAGMMMGSDLRILPYLLTRCLQVPLAVGIVYLATLLPLHNYLAQPVMASPFTATWFPWVAGVYLSAGLVLALFIGCILSSWWRRLKNMIIIR